MTTDFDQKGIDLLKRSDRVEASLWRNHKNAPGSKTRLLLFEYYSRFAKKIAYKIYYGRPPDNFEKSDIEQLAFQGLLESIDRFEPNKNNNFKSYASYRIKGNINNGLSKSSEASAHYKYQKRAEKDRLNSLMGPSEADHISELSKLVVMIAIGLIVESDSNNSQEQFHDKSATAYDSLAWSELRHEIFEQIAKLPEKESFIITNHYQNDISFRQIGEIMSLSKGRVSQLHHQALKRMRSKMAKFR